MKEETWLSITPLSPLHLGEIKPNFSFLSSKDSVPGSLLRGSLAEYLKANSKDSEIKAFVKDMHFGFSFPSLSSFLPPFLLPQTSLQCRQKPGFKADKGHGIFDSLLPALAYHELKDCLKAKIPVPLTFSCLFDACQGRMEQASGFYVKEGNNYKKVNVEKVSQTKVAISRERRAAQAEMLYSVTAVRPRGVVFLGKVRGDEEQVEALTEALNTLGLGAFTTRGYGKVNVSSVPNGRVTRMEGIRTRVQKFNQKLEEVWEEILSISLIQDLPKRPPGVYFAISLVSPAILRDQKGIPALKLELKIGGKWLSPTFSSTYPQFIGGWSTAWGLPKETQLAAGMGSVYVFCLETESEELYRELKRLEKEGIGEKRDEGYGEVLICHPFHQEVRQI